METFKTETEILNISIDESPESPREWDNMGTMICSHRRYDLGDKHEINFDDYSGWDEAKKAIIKKYDVAVILPLYLYDHSGITMATTPFSCRWDSGQVGFIVVSKKKLREEYSVKRITKKHIEKVTTYLKGEVETYDTYLRGDVYSFEVTDKEGNHIDSCSGFYGNDFATNGIGEHVSDELAELLKK